VLLEVRPAAVTLEIGRFILHSGDFVRCRIPAGFPVVEKEGRPVAFITLVTNSFRV
jgi:hypothetical protein